jgi:hypothetical protein
VCLPSPRVDVSRHSNCGITAGIQRPEVILEGTDDGATWREYHCMCPPQPAVHPGRTCDWLLIASYPSPSVRYKPGDVTDMPNLAAPHMPRVDWYDPIGQCMIPLARPVARMRSRDRPMATQAAVVCGAGREPPQPVARQSHPQAAQRLANGTSPRAAAWGCHMCGCMPIAPCLALPASRPGAAGARLQTKSLPRHAAARDQGVAVPLQLHLSQPYVCM